MSYGSVVASSIDERKRREAEKRRQEAERTAERLELADKIRETMPDMVDDAGRVDGFAIYAALMLKHAGQPLTPRAIRDRRAKHNLGDRTVAQAEREGWDK